MTWGALLLLAYLVILLASAALAAYFLVGFPGLTPRPPPAEAPLISIIVPVRNEEEIVGRCVDSLLAIDYPRREIIVVDGGSEDGTMGILRGYGDRITLVEESPLPRGWIGKNWGCHQGYLKSQGELLLFTDGDTLHSPGGLGAAIAHLQAEGIDLLSLYPKLITIGFWEKLLIPLVGYFILLMHRGRLVNRDDKPYFIGVGPFLLFRRGVYEAVGGHAAVRDRIDEDMRLGERVKRAGYKLRVLRGDWVVQLRMYQNFPELWEGWVKNIAPGLDYSAPKVAFACLLPLFYFALPFLLLIRGLLLVPASGVTLTLEVGAAGYALTYVNFLPYHWGKGRDWRYPLLMPLASWIFVAMAITSLHRHRSGRGVSWKGRQYRPLQDVPHE